MSRHVLWCRAEAEVEALQAQGTQVWSYHWVRALGSGGFRGGVPVLGLACRMG